MSNDSNKKTKEKKSLTRFNVIYEDPYKIFLRYIKGELNLYEIGQKCKYIQNFVQFYIVYFLVKLSWMLERKDADKTERI